jgi:small subunit ribosomal protein S12
MATLRQLALYGREKRVRRCKVAALKGAPHRRGVIVKMGTTTPKKPNSAKRKFAKVRVLASKKLVFAHVSGVGTPYIQEFSIVLVEGGNPPDVPGINYTLVRGVYDFDMPEKYGRTRRRSKFGTKGPFEKFLAKSSLKDRITMTMVEYK